MAKYLRKSNSDINTEVPITIMEITGQKSPLGVRTRAKTLALQATTAGNTSPSSFGYLQLRNRRLLRPKPPVYKEPRKVNSNSRGRAVVQDKGTVSPNPNLGNSSSSSPNSGARATAGGDDKLIGSAEANWQMVDDNVEEVNACYGENVMDGDSRERGTRESTPSNLIRDPDVIHTPGSTTRRTSSADAALRLCNSAQRHIPTSHEMEQFFAGAEGQLQREFVEKYNFDPVTDKPLPGRYEWEKVKPDGDN